MEDAENNTQISIKSHNSLKKEYISFLVMAGMNNFHLRSDNNERKFNNDYNFKRNKARLINIYPAILLNTHTRTTNE